MCCTPDTIVQCLVHGAAVRGGAVCVLGRVLVAARNAAMHLCMCLQAGGCRRGGGGFRSWHSGCSSNLKEGWPEGPPAPSLAPAMAAVEPLLPGAGYLLAARNVMCWPRSSGPFAVFELFTSEGHRKLNLRPVAVLRSARGARPAIASAHRRSPEPRSAQTVLIEVQTSLAGMTAGRGGAGARGPAHHGAPGGALPRPSRSQFLMPPALPSFPNGSHTIAVIYARLARLQLASGACSHTPLPRASGGGDNSGGRH